MKKIAGGFTLIELMVVIAILGIIAAAAVPNYMLYVAKSKTTSASVELFSLRTKVLVYLHENNTFPADAEAVGVDNTRVADYWQNPEIDDGTVSVVFANIDGELNGETISMTPSTSAEGIVTWVCTSTVTNKAKLPEDCRG